jgi:type 1 glutamine amidotransferase
MGTVKPDYIDRFVKLFGACHGGPDRKDNTFDLSGVIVDRHHPICRGVTDFDVRDEIYYQLKFVQPRSSVMPLVNAKIEGSWDTISWAWERPDGGRSFGFSGLHFHENWRLEQYRRLVTQGILWTLGVPIPSNGVPVDVPDEILQLQ